MARPVVGSAVQRKVDLSRRPDPVETSGSLLGQQALLAGLDALGSAAALLDSRGSVLAINRAAEILLAPLLDIADHRLKGRSRESELRLLRLYDVLERSAQAVAILPDPSPMLLRAVRLGTPLGRATTLVTFAAVGEVGLPPEATLREAFDLTPTEACVALAIASGRDLRSIARGRGVSVETIRSHLRNVFSKTGIGRQAGLVAMIAALPKP